MMETEPLFKSAHDALVFAYSYSGQQFDKSLMLKMAAGGTKSGKGLVGNDGAAQAGMIRQEVLGLGRIVEAVLIVRFAPRAQPCECRSACCKGYKDNFEWRNAVSFLADHVRMSALAGTTANAIVRRECVLRYFEQKDKRVGVETFAEKHNLHRESAGAYIGRVGKWLGGEPARADKPAVVGIDQAAMAAIETRLLEIGMVGR